MVEGVAPPCFGAIASALLEQVRHEAACEKFAEPFMRALPSSAPGLHHAHRMFQRRLVLMAEAQRLFAQMAAHEVEIRILAHIEPGTRRLDD
jgi:hypothetical protein